MLAGSPGGGRGHVTEAAAAHCVVVAADVGVGRRRRRRHRGLERRALGESLSAPDSRLFARVCRPPVSGRLATTSFQKASLLFCSSALCFLLLFRFNLEQPSRSDYFASSGFHCDTAPPVFS